MPASAEENGQRIRRIVDTGEGFVYENEVSFPIKKVKFVETLDWSD